MFPRVWQEIKHSPLNIMIQSQSSIKINSQQGRQNNRIQKKKKFKQGQAIKILVRLNNVKDVKRCMNILLGLPARDPFCYEQDSKYFTNQISPLQSNPPKGYISFMYASRFSKFAVILFTSLNPPINLIHSKIKIVLLKLLPS